MVSRSSFFKVVPHTFFDLQVGKFISAGVTMSSIVAFLFIQLKSLWASGLIEVFKILHTDSLQLLNPDIFKPRDFTSKRRRLILPLMGIFNHILWYLFKIVSSIFCFTHVSVRSQIENYHRSFKKTNLCAINILFFGCKGRTLTFLMYFQISSIILSLIFVQSIPTLNLYQGV